MICKSSEDSLTSINSLYNKLKTVAIDHLKYVDRINENEINDEKGEFYENAEGYAMKHFSFHICYKCNEPYCSGANDCSHDMENEQKAQDYICLSCKPPAMIEESFQSILKAAAGNALYLCPNDHPYFIGQCAWPNEAGTCSICKVPIGNKSDYKGTHRAADGNRRVGYIDRNGTLRIETVDPFTKIETDVANMYVYLDEITGTLIIRTSPASPKELKCTIVDAKETEKVNNLNNIITFGTGGQNGNVSQTFNNEKNPNKDRDDVNNNHHNNSNSNNYNNNNNNNRNRDNGENDKNDHKSDTEEEYTCNVPWHVKRIKELERIISQKNHEIEGLKMKLQQHSAIANITQNQAVIENKTSDIILSIICKDNMLDTVSEVIINPSKKLTHQTIPNVVVEKFVNAYNYMKQYQVFHGPQAMRKCNDNKNVIIDYNFHQKHESKEIGTETLHAVCDKRYKYLPSLTTGAYGTFCFPSISNEFEYDWKMRHELFTTKEAKEVFNISTMEIPTPIKMKSVFMEYLVQTMQRVAKALKDDTKRNAFIINKRNKWNRGEIVPIFNKQSSKSELLCLKLTKQQFMKRLCQFNDNLPRDNNDRVYDINLVPIIKNTHFEIVWIVSIRKDVNIGISLKLDKNKASSKNKKNYESIVPLGVYLDINDEHKLVPYKHHNCQCLSDFICSIDVLQIGDEQNQIHQKYNTLQKQYKHDVISLQNQLNDANNKRENDSIKIKQLKNICMEFIANNEKLIGDNEKLKSINNYYFIQNFNPASTIIPHPEHNTTHSINMNAILDIIKH